LKYTYVNLSFVFVSVKEKLELNVALAGELHFWGENSVPPIWEMKFVMCLGHKAAIRLRAIWKTKLKNIKKKQTA